MSLEEFYVGYLPMPARLKRFLAGAIAMMLVAIVLLAVLGFLTQVPADDGVFEYGVIREFEGRVIAGAAPAILTGDGPFLLVRPWKVGASDLVEGIDGARVRLAGTLIERGTVRMIEVVPDSIEVIADPDPSEARSEHISLGQVTLVGEIVDSKCHLGVMKPGEGKIHRSCASLCIRGGIPPLFVASAEATGETIRAILVAGDGSAVNDDVLSMIAEPVEITGELEIIDEILRFRADPAGYRRLGDGGL